MIDYIITSDTPLIFYCFGLIFLIHALAFIPSFIYKTEKFFDFTGMIAYIAVIFFGLYLKQNIIGDIDTESIILSTLILIWTIRLGSFLFYRVLKSGKDRRFSDMKQSFSKFLPVWIMSTLWVCITSAPALCVITSEVLKYDKLGELIPIDYSLIYIGIFIWCFGFLFECIADFQKIIFKSKIKNKDKFINSGLWSVSRHPNYFGEIILWIGISMISSSMLTGWQYISLISPIFVYILLTSISGINLLEKYADNKWGDLDSYKKYKKETPELIPKFWN